MVAPEGDPLGPDGKPFPLAELVERPAWVEFWSPWDPASRRRMLDLQEMLEQDPDLAKRWRVVAVALAATPEQVAEVVPPGSPLLVLEGDSALARSYGVDQVPATVLTAAGGRVLERREGYVEPAVLRGMLEAAFPAAP